jgi:hypothetical protein
MHSTKPVGDELGRLAADPVNGWPAGRTMSFYELRDHLNRQDFRTSYGEGFSEGGNRGIARAVEAAYWYHSRCGRERTAWNIAHFYRDASGRVAWRFREGTETLDQPSPTFQEAPPRPSA